LTPYQIVLHLHLESVIAMQWRRGRRVGVQK